MMTKPVRRPHLPRITKPEAGAALDRLLAIAKGDTAGAKLVADFLLNWWDGAHGAWTMVDITNVDPETGEDMLIIIAFLAQNGVYYADAWQRKGDMIALMERWNWKGCNDA